jgi:hypothetical protein
MWASSPTLEPNAPEIGAVEAHEEGGRSRRVLLRYSVFKDLEPSYAAWGSVIGSVDVPGSAGIGSAASLERCGMVSRSMVPSKPGTG